MYRRRGCRSWFGCWGRRSGYRERGSWRGSRLRCRSGSWFGHGCRRWRSGRKRRSRGHRCISRRRRVCWFRRSRSRKHRGVSGNRRSGRHGRSRRRNRRRNSHRNRGFAGAGYGRNGHSQRKNHESNADGTGKRGQVSHLGNPLAARNRGFLPQSPQPGTRNKGARKSALSMQVRVPAPCSGRISRRVNQSDCGNGNDSAKPATRQRRRAVN